MNKDSYLNKIITEIKIADDQEALLFQCQDGYFVVRCDADCCSHTWIENVELPALGFPAQILGIDDLDMRDPEDIDCGVIQFYGCKITTDKGEIVIDYRNESNGYYGGHLSWPHENYFYGGVYGQNISKENWIEVKDASTGD